MYFDTVFRKCTDLNETVVEADTIEDDMLIVSDEEINMDNSSHLTPSGNIKVNDTGSSGSSSVVSAVEQTESAVQSNYASSSSSTSSSSSSSSDSYYETFGYSTGSSGGGGGGSNSRGGGYNTRFTEF